MECIQQCIAGLSGEGQSEFGSLAYSPLSLSQIRARQEWNQHPLTYTIGNENKGPITLRYAYLCQRGLYPDDLDKENQDAFKIIPDFDGESRSIVMGVFDGHGEYGDDCSGFVRDHLESYLIEARGQHGGDMEKSFRAAFRKLNSQMHYRTDFSDALSGTTAIVAYFEKTAVWVANVGDSRAIVGKIANGELKATPLSTDQTPYRKDERERVRAAGGEIMSVDQRDGHVPMHDNWDMDLGAETDTDGDPPRVWVPGKDKPGCAFTRSIGDSMGERVGVIADPELTKKELKEHDQFVCICSDGVWEFLTNSAVADIIANHDSDPLAACRAVVAESYRLWLQFDIRTDDITMVLAFVEFQNKKVASAPKGGKGRGSIRGSVTVGGDTLNKTGGARPVRRGLSRAKRGVIASLVADDSGVLTSMDDLPKVPKSAEEMSNIRQALKTHFLFAQLADVQKDKAFEAMRRVECSVGDIIYNKGDVADAFYVLGSGEFSNATPSSSGGGDTDVSVIKATDKAPHPTFGELALMYSQARTAKVTCTRAGVLFAMDRSVFKTVIKFGGAGSNKQTRALETLKSIDILRSLSGDMLKRLAQGLEEVTYMKDEYIVRQGDETQSLYLIMEGHVRCTATKDGVEQLLMELSAGAYFGERSLLLSMPRAANVIADKKTTCLYMSKEMFEQNLGSLQEIIDKDRKSREKVSRVRRERQIELGLESPELGDFELQGLAVESDFGQWVLAKKGGGLYTLKAVDIGKAAAEATGARIMHESRLAAKLVEPNSFVPNALQTMESPSYLLTIFSTRVATDLHTLLQDYGPFDEGTCLFYAANIFLGLEHLHSCDVAYRNINPEAVLVREDGYAILADLRFAKEVDNNKMYDLCGLTPYLAPEQVSGIGHTHAVDYWALGILIYEMITERTPFSTSPDESEEKIYARIASHFTGALVFPDAFSLELVGILDKLLEPSAAQRLCTSQQFRSNPWLEVVNWRNLEACSAPAPFLNEAAKRMSEHMSKGKRDCLPAPPFDGQKSWFDGFANHDANQSFGRNSYTSPMERSGGGSGSSALESAEEENPRISISGYGGRKKGKKAKEVHL